MCQACKIYPSNVKEYGPSKQWKTMQTILQVAANCTWPPGARQPRNSKMRKNRKTTSLALYSQHICLV